MFGLWVSDGPTLSVMNWIVLPDQAACNSRGVLDVSWIVKVMRQKLTYKVAVFHRASCLCPSEYDLVLCSNDSLSQLSIGCCIKEQNISYGTDHQAASVCTRFRRRHPGR